MSNTEQTLRKLLQKIIQEQQYEKAEVNVKSISSGGANFTSELFQASIAAPGKPELKLFAKVAVVPDQMRKMLCVEAFEIEAFYFNDLSPIYDSIQMKKNLKKEEKFIFPKCFGLDSTYLEETVVMEDLTAQGYVPFDRFSTFNWEYASSAVSQLAKFHALSISYSQTNPEEFKAIADKRKMNPKVFDQIKQAFGDFKQPPIDAAEEQYKDKVKEFMEIMFDDEGSFKKFYQPQRITVLNHGDFRPSNLMHKELENGKYEVIAVDYQTIQSGCPVIDLLYFIFTGSDEEFRRNHFDQIIEHYYKELSMAMKRLGVDVEKTYSRKDFDFELKESMIYGLAMSSFMLPLILVEPDKIPRVGLKDVKDFFVEPNKLYPLRLNGVIRDYIRWGLL